MPLQRIIPNCVSLVSPPCHFKILSRFLKHTVITISFPSGCDAPCPFKDTHRHAPTHIYSIMPCRHAHAYQPYVDIYNIFHRSVDSLLAVNVKRERREFESTQAILCRWIGWILLDSSRFMAKWCTPSVENIRTPCCYWAAPQATSICFFQTQRNVQGTYIRVRSKFSPEFTSTAFSIT